MLMRKYFSGPSPLVHSSPLPCYKRGTLTALTRELPSLCPTWLSLAGAWPWLAFSVEGRSGLINPRLLGDSKTSLVGILTFLLFFALLICGCLRQVCIDKPSLPLNLTPHSVQGRTVCVQSRADLQLAFHLENVCCNKYTKICFFKGV